MDQYIEDNGIEKRKEKELEYKNGKMGLNTLESGRMIKQLDLVNYYMLMVIFMRDFGLKTWLMVMEGIRMKMELYTKVDGIKTSRRGLGEKSGLTVQFTLAALKEG
mmetsp:Transcript_33728/g.24759  ORF Transcript_33728/g.24759 Transcript_33728/m.24759 type:complete len:106 (+) Transcript_33728:490-807(+)|eukprot:CAMPEP_0202963152 /NCGR_PEP_ID=MMETSP1396-20130829/7145_1 /ASSEMBLY_ACC=CAM_ASM_000872 /TAXON_ID= /ORGANISM="Pseudokeronopsis sp., Strain Brazil" /LENGTH=105 /DNA_ID=CAMNT_0049684135 /DNA_START=437 /DNA_END=754 /DNA_ORIENTATION=+